MTEILSWMLGIAWRLAVIYIGFTALKYVIRNGNRTFRELLETAGLAIRAGCLTARKKLVDRLQREAEDEKEEEHIEDNDAPAMQVTGTVR